MLKVQQKALQISINLTKSTLVLKYIETLREMTSGKDNKTVYIPYEAASVISSIGSISSLFPKK